MDNKLNYKELFTKLIIQYMLDNLKDSDSFIKNLIYNLNYVDEIFLNNLNKYLTDYMNSKNNKYSIDIETNFIKTYPVISISLNVKENIFSTLFKVQINLMDISDELNYKFIFQDYFTVDLIELYLLKSNFLEEGDTNSKFEIYADLIIGMWFRYLNEGDMIMLKSKQFTIVSDHLIKFIDYYLEPTFKVHELNGRSMSIRIFSKLYRKLKENVI